MTIHLVLISENPMVLRLVGDFARGLGYTVATAPVEEGRGIQMDVPDGADTVLEVLSYVALSATKAGIDVSEPRCRVTYRHPSAPSEVTLGLRVAEFNITGVATPGTRP
jgi:hypothetical protein